MVWSRGLSRFFITSSKRKRVNLPLNNIHSLALRAGNPVLTSKRHLSSTTVIGATIVTSSSRHLKQPPPQAAATSVVDGLSLSQTFAALTGRSRIVSPACRIHWRQRSTFHVSQANGSMNSVNVILENHAERTVNTVN